MLDLTHFSAAELRATADYLRALADLRDAPKRIAHDDRPDVGLPVRAILPPPVLDVPAAVVPAPPSPAEAFGAAAKDVPPPPPPFFPPPQLPADGRAAAGAPAAPLPGVELDSKGLPWDARIHSGTHDKTSAGVWRQKRNLTDKTYKEAVEAELRGGAPAQLTPPLPPQLPLPLPQGAPAVPLPPAAPPAAPHDLPSLMGALTPRMIAGEVTMPEIIEACTTVGVATLPDLRDKPDLIPQVWALLK